MSPQDTQFVKGYVLEGFLGEERMNDLIDSGFTVGEIEEILKSTLSVNVKQSVKEEMMKLAGDINLSDLIPEDKIKDLVVRALMGPGYKKALDKGLQPSDLHESVSESLEAVAKARVARQEKSMFKKIKNIGDSPVKWKHVGGFAIGLAAVGGVAYWYFNKGGEDTAGLLTP